ncbi:MAG: hypothetical protein ACAI38_23545 [Myxococcota bacterium]
MFDIGPPPPPSQPKPAAPRELAVSTLLPRQAVVKVAEPPKDVVQVLLQPPPEPPVPGTFLGPLTVRVDNALKPVLRLGPPLIFLAGTAAGALACVAAGSIAALAGYDPQPFFAATEYAMPAGTIGLPAALIFIGFRAEAVRRRYRDAGRII